MHKTILLSGLGFTTAITGTPVAPTHPLNLLASQTPSSIDYPFTPPFCLGPDPEKLVPSYRDCLRVLYEVRHLPWYNTPQIYGTGSRRVQREVPFTVKHGSCYFGLNADIAKTPHPQERFALSDVYPAIHSIRQTCVIDGNNVSRYGGYSWIGQRRLFLVALDGRMTSELDMGGNVSTIQFGNGPIIELPANATANEGYRQVNEEGLWLERPDMVVGSTE
ncbi:MAG: hypothetical protein Q9163_002617 [Psora crenata]